MPQKILKQKTKNVPQQSPRKNAKKFQNPQKIAKFATPMPQPSICVKIHVFLNFAINDVAMRSIFSVKLKEGTHAVILHSVLAPADTCSMRGVRLNFEFWQLGFQGFESQPLARGAEIGARGAEIGSREQK
jgi:hypothetical protein